MDEEFAEILANNEAVHLELGEALMDEELAEILAEMRLYM